MKKFLVLALVLGAASLASAAFELVGPIELKPSDTVTIDFLGEAGGRGLYYVIVVDGNPGTFLDVALNANAGDTSSAVGYQEGGWGNGYELTVADKDSDAQIFAGVWASLTFHCDGRGDVLIEAYRDPDYSAPVASLLIHQVPEPATMALLGLGALFLRRTK